MNQLLSLTLDLQVILVAGYLAYKTTTVGRTNPDRTEDFLFKVLAYGLIGRVAAQVLQWIAQQAGIGTALSAEVVFVMNSAAVVIVAAMIAALWRAKGSSWFSTAMKALRVYDDDHHASTWDSIVETRALWDFVQVHLPNGDVLESSFTKVPLDVPMGKITLNADGLAVYVTRILRDDGTEADFPCENGQGFSQITYVPRDQIRQLEVCWRRR